MSDKEKNQVESPEVLVFGLGISYCSPQGKVCNYLGSYTANTILQIPSIYGWCFVFFQNLISKGKVTNLKIPGIFPKKYVFNLPTWISSEIAKLCGWVPSTLPLFLAG